MFDRKTPISVSDIESGRFGKLAEFVRENWPFDAVPSEEIALEIVAKSLGYRNYAEALGSASPVAVPSLAGKHSIRWNFEALGFAPQARVEHKGYGYEDIAGLLGQEDAVRDFVNSWPIELVSRWGYESGKCIFSADLLKDFEGEASRLWRNNLKSSDGFQTSTESNKSAAAIVATMIKGRSVSEISGLAISDILDDDLAEALFLDFMPVLLREILIVNAASARRLVESSGLSIQDIWRTPKTEVGFPNLYAYMRGYIKENLLSAGVMSLFTQAKRSDGFYSHPGEFPSEELGLTFSVDRGVIRLNIERDELEDNTFRTYTWFSQLQSSGGEILAKAMGTYVSGPANKDASGFQLISALDEMCDIDVDIADLVLTALQKTFLEDDGEFVEKGAINTRVLFAHGNLVTLVRWERSELSNKGDGLILLHGCLDAMKKKFRRDMHVAALVNPAQYLEDASLVENLEAQRVVDIGKIAQHLSSLVYSHKNVVSVFAGGSKPADGLSTFAEYCREEFLSDE